MRARRTRGRFDPQKSTRDTTRSINGILDDPRTLKATECWAAVPAPDQKPQGGSIGLSASSAYPVPHITANDILSPNLPSCSMASEEDPRFELDTTTGVSYEAPWSDYRAQVPAHTKQPFPMSAYRYDNHNESVQLEKPCDDSPPPAEFISWAHEQDRLETSPSHISIWSRCLRVSPTTVEKWYQQYKTEEPPIGNDGGQMTHLGPRSSAEAGIHRPKCLENLKAKGRYINSPNAAARGPYACTSGCGVNYSRKNDWRRHEDNNFPLDEWSCTMCLQEFSRSDKVVSHLEKVHDFLSKEWTCTVCYSNFNRPNKLALHMMTAHKKKDFTASGFSFKSLADNYNRQCHHCSAKFPTLKEFYNHALGHIEGRTTCPAPTVEAQNPIATGIEPEADLVQVPEPLNHHRSDGMTFEDSSLEVGWL